MFSLHLFLSPLDKIPPAVLIIRSGAGRETGHGPPVVVSLYSAPAGVTLSSCAPPRAPTLSPPLSVSLGATPAGRKGSWPHTSAWQATREFGIAKRDRILRQRSVKVGTSYRRVVQIAKSVNWLGEFWTFKHAAKSKYSLYGLHKWFIAVHNIAPSVTIYLSRVMLWMVANSNKSIQFFYPKFSDDLFLE